MKWNILLIAILVVNLTACALTPEQKAIKEAKRVRAEQALQVELARQCDAETADVMYQQFNQPLNWTKKEREAFEKRYVEKVNNPMFQACYKLAWQNYKAQEEIRQMRYDHSREYGFGFGGFSDFCNACW